jgi:hypothetical protein
MGKNSIIRIPTMRVKASLVTVVVSLAVGSVAFAAENIQFKGDIAFAYFNSQLPDTCILSNVWAGASDGVLHDNGTGAPTKSSEIYISFQEYDYCMSTWVRYGDGYAILGGSVLDGAMVNLTPDPSHYAEIQDAKNGTLFK